MIKSVSTSSIHEYSATTSNFNKHQNADSSNNEEKSSLLYSDIVSDKLNSNVKAKKASKKEKKHTIAESIASMDSDVSLPEDVIKIKNKAKNPSSIYTSEKDSSPVADGFDILV